MSWKEFFTGYKGKDLPPELKDFNWGALLLTFIWGIKHRAWITLLAIPFNLVPITTWNKLDIIHTITAILRI